MGDVRVELRLMNADGALFDHSITNAGETTILQLANDRIRPFHSEESQAESGRQLALFYVSRRGTVLEPCCEGVTVQPPEPDASAFTSDGRVVIPPSEPGKESHHYVHLRPDDVIHFEAHRWQIRYSVHDPDAHVASQLNMPPLTVNPQDIQVKSSDPQQLEHQAGLSESETEDEDAGDLARTTTPVHVTSATSRVAASKEVKETPSHTVSEEDAPFSTAINQLENPTSEPVLQTNGVPSSEIKLTGEAIRRLEASSPGAQAGRSRVERAIRSQVSQSHVQSFSDSDFTGWPGMIKKHYGGRSRRNTPNKRAKADEGYSEATTPDQQDAAPSEPQVDPKTSPTLYPKGRAYEAATRSMSRKRKTASEPTDDDDPAKKVRKLSAVEDGVQDDETIAQGTRILSDAGDETNRSGKASKAPAGAAADSETEDEESDDDSPSQIPAGSAVSSGRLPRVARAQDSDDEEIALKPKKKTTTRQKSSPEVVVRPQRASRPSKTSAGTQNTPSSTATSSLSGKAPKILTSNVAGKYTGTSPATKFLKSHGSTIIEDVQSRRTNFICVVKDDSDLIKSPKVLRSLALGKLIVTERWISESKSAGELLDPADFIHPEVAGTVGLDRRQLFYGKVLYFTNAVVTKYGKGNWDEMQGLVTDAGASSVESGSGDKGGKMTGRNSIIYIGTDDDADATLIIEEYSHVVYHKDLIKDAVVSGKLDLKDDKFKLKATAKKKGGRR